MGLQLSGPAWFEDVAIPVNAGVVTPQELTPQKQLWDDKYIWGLLLEVYAHVRAATGAATPLTYNDEFPLGFIDRVRTEGEWVPSGRSKGQREFLNLSGPTLVQYVNHFSPRVLEAQYSFNGGALTQATGTSAPTKPTLASSANNDFDFRFVILIPFPPLGIPIEQQALFMLRGPDWKNLYQHFTIADASGLFDHRTGTTFTFGAYGSGSGAVAGNPLVRVSMIRPNMQSMRNAINPALVWRTFQQSSLNSVLQGSTVSDALIARLSVTPNMYNRFLLKTGVKPSDIPTSGVNAVINGLSDSEVTRPLVKKNGAVVRNPKSTFASKAWINFAHATDNLTGYYLQDFLESGDANTFFDTSKLTKDTFTLEGDVTGAANQIGELMEERVEAAS